MRTNEPSDDDPREHERLDRATDALREAFDSQPAPQAVVGATLARLGTLRVSKPPENRTPLPRRIRLQRIVRVAAAVAIVAALFFWLTTWPRQTSALAQAARNVQTAKSVVFDLRAKSGKQQEQVSRVKILGDVIRQEDTNTRLYFINHRTGETLNSSTLGWAVSGQVPDRKPLNGDPITQLLGLLEGATQRLPDEMVEGVACLVFQGHDTSPLGIAGPGELKLWLDAKTKLPNRIEARWPNRAWDPQAYVIGENFKWNVDLEPSEFDMETILGEHRSPREIGVGMPSVASDHGKPKLVTASGDGDIKDFLDRRRLEVRVKPPSFDSSPAESRDQSGLRLIGLAIHHYLDRHQQRLPPATVLGPDGKTPHSWRVEILPFLGKGGEALYKEYRLDEPWDSPANKLVLAQMPDVFRMPATTCARRIRLFLHRRPRHGVRGQGRHQDRPDFRRHGHDDPFGRSQAQHPVDEAGRYPLRPGKTATASRRFRRRQVPRALCRLRDGPPALDATWRTDPQRVGRAE